MQVWLLTLPPGTDGANGAAAEEEWWLLDLINSIEFQWPVTLFWKEPWEKEFLLWGF